MYYLYLVYDLFLFAHYQIVTSNAMDFIVKVSNVSVITYLMHKNVNMMVIAERIFTLLWLMQFNQHYLGMKNNCYLEVFSNLLKKLIEKSIRFQEMGTSDTREYHAVIRLNGPLALFIYMKV